MLSCVFEISCVFDVVWGRGGVVFCVNRLIDNNARFGLGLFPNYKAAIKTPFPNYKAAIKTPFPNYKVAIKTQFQNYKAAIKTPFPNYKAAIKTPFLGASLGSTGAAPGRSCSQFHP